MPRSTLLPGLLGLAIIYVSVALPAPFITILNGRGINGDQTCLVRGFLALAILLPLGWPSLRVRPTQGLLGMACTIALAAYALTQGCIVWGPSLTMSVAAIVPVGTVAIAFWRRKPVHPGEIICLLLAMGGVAITLQPWHDWHKFNLAGLVWSLGGVIGNILFIECLGDTTNEPPLRRMTWQALGVGLVGIPGSLNATWLPLQHADVAGQLLFVGLLLGIVNFWGNGLATANLPTTFFSVAVLGLTPFTILFSNYMLNQSFSTHQWVGVWITMIGVGLLSAIPKDAPQEVPPALNYANETC